MPPTVPTKENTALDLRILVGHAVRVQGEMSVELVQSEFSRSNADFIAVVDGEKLLGVCARRELIQALGSRFGFSLNARQPVRTLLMASPMMVTTEMPVTEVFKKVSARVDREFYDDVLLMDAHGHYAGMIPMCTLVRLQTEFLLGNIVNLEASKHEIAEKNREMEQDLLMAREVQLAMLPQTHLPVTTGDLMLEIAHRFHPAGGVSGDFFDVLRLSNGETGILVCDVMGHGVRSALITAMVRAMVEELKPVASDPGFFLTRLNRDLTAILRQTGSLIFVTAAYVVLDPAARRVRYSQAGHPTPLRWNEQSGKIRPMLCSQESAGPALGLIEDFEFASTNDDFGIGDRFALYTDGITEAPAADGMEFGATRLAESLTHQKGQLLDAALDRLLIDLRTFCGTSSFPDDVCVVTAELSPKIAE